MPHNSWARTRGAQLSAGPRAYAAENQSVGKTRRRSIYSADRHSLRHAMPASQSGSTQLKAGNAQNSNGRWKKLVVPTAVNTEGCIVFGSELQTNIHVLRVQPNYQTYLIISVRRHANVSFLWLLTACHMHSLTVWFVDWCMHSWITNIIFWTYDSHADDCTTQPLNLALLVKLCHNSYILFFFQRRTPSAAEKIRTS